MAVASHICIYKFITNVREVERDTPLCRESPPGLYEHTEHTGDVEQQ